MDDRGVVYVLYSKEGFCFRVRGRFRLIKYGLGTVLVFRKGKSLSQYVAVHQITLISESDVLVVRKTAGHLSPNFQAA